MTQLGQEMDGVSCNAFMMPASGMRLCEAGSKNERDDGPKEWHEVWLGQFIRLSNVFYSFVSAEY